MSKRLAAGEARSLGLVVTGGTIGAEYEEDAVVRLPNTNANSEVELLKAAWSGPATLDLRVRRPIRTLSENMRPKDWLAIAQAATALVEQHHVAGILVLHGTDTASYTAAALSFLLSGLPVPVVLTGSNLPPNQTGSDALTNIHDALIALCHLERGTYLSFAGSPESPSWVHVGTHVRKARASGQAFVSVNYGPVAKVTDDAFFLLDQAPPVKLVPASLALDDRVFSFRIYPGCDLGLIWNALVGSDIRGVVIELYASATGPDGQRSRGDKKYSLPAFVSRCVDAGMVVVGAVSEAPDTANAYESALAIQDVGAFFSWPLLPEVATVKLMWALAQRKAPDEVRGLVAQPVAGEFDSRSRAPLAQA
jgi:L-asparaginase/Glu-tRNA(Gln) amidotransferase subunit D